MVAAACAADKATVWVYDHQLQLVPCGLRSRRPDVRIGPFNHVPFPGYEIFAQLPWRRQLVQGMLGAHLIGFQRPADATNFLRACRRVAPNSRGPEVHALSAPNADSTGDARAGAADGTYESGVFRSRSPSPSSTQIELARHAAFHGVMHRRAEASRPQRTQGLLRRAVQETCP